MDFTDEELLDASRDASPASSFTRASGRTKNDTEFAELRSELATLCITDPDATLYVARLARDEVVATCGVVEAKCDELTALLQAIPVGTKAVTPDLDALDTIDGHLSAMSVERGDVARNRRLALVDANARKYVSSV